MKRVFRWLALGLAVAGLVQTPFLIAEALSQAAADHRMIVGYLVGFLIRFLFIIFLAKFCGTRVQEPTQHRGHLAAKP